VPVVPDFEYRIKPKPQWPNPGKSKAVRKALAEQYFGIRPKPPRHYPRHIEPDLPLDNWDPAWDSQCPF
jgi:hypothetical protein